MPDWQSIVRRRLGPLPLDPARSADVVDELAQQQVDAHRVATLWQVARPFQRDQPTACELGDPRAPRIRLTAIFGAVQDQHRTADLTQDGLALGR